MTDITTEIAAHGVRIPSLRTPILVIGRGTGCLLKACGEGLVNLSKAYAHASELAYLKPVRNAVERQRQAVDADLEGRDPSW